MYSRNSKGTSAVGHSSRNNKLSSALPRIKNSNRGNNTEPSSTSTLCRNEARIIPKHSDGLISGLEAMWRQDFLCDVTLVVENSRFHCHKALLAASADYFYELMLGATEEILNNNFEIELSGLLPSTVETLLECMYTGHVLINDYNVQELLEAAAYLRHYTLEEACADYLRSSLKVTNCIKKIALASTYNLEDLVDEAMKIAARNFMEVSESRDFHYLSVNHLVQLLGRDDVKAKNELHIFHRALSWIDHDKANRKTQAALIMQQIRLPLLSTTDIVDHVETIDYLVDCSECQKLIKEALHYHCLPARQSILQNQRTRPRTINQHEVVLAIGGAPRLKDDPISSDIYYYDPDKRWQPLTKLVQPRHHHAAAVLGGFLYVAGGEPTNDQRSPVNTAFRYDPRNHTWLQIANMKNKRESFNLGVLNNMLYAVGGRVDGDHSLSSVERYNPAVDKWELVASISTPRRSVAVATHAGRLYAVGGSGDGRISSRVERYNPLTNQWENRCSLSVPRFFALLEQVGSGLLLFGGATVTNSGQVICVKDVEQYNPQTDTWCVMSPMMQPRAEAGSTVINNKIYVVGGYSWDKKTRLRSVECYDVEKDQWEEINSIEHAYTGITSATITVYDLPKCRDTDDGVKNAVVENVRSEAEANELTVTRLDSPKKASSAY